MRDFARNLYIYRKSAAFAPSDMMLRSLRSRTNTESSSRHNLQSSRRSSVGDFDKRRLTNSAAYAAASPVERDSASKEVVKHGQLEVQQESDRPVHEVELELLTSLCPVWRSMRMAERLGMVPSPTQSLREGRKARWRVVIGAAHVEKRNHSEEAFATERIER